MAIHLLLLHVIDGFLLHLLFMGAITWVLLWVFKGLFCTNAHACTTTSHDDSKCCRILPGSSGFPFVGETLAFVRAYRGTNGVYDFVKKRHLKYIHIFFLLSFNNLSFSLVIYNWRWEKQFTFFLPLKGKPWNIYNFSPLFLYSCRYGDCFRTNIFGQTHVFISRTNVAKSLLGSESIDFSKRYIKSIGELLGKQSMLCSSHEHHAFLRRHISNLFTSDSLAPFIEHFDELTVQILKQWERKKHVVVFDDAMKVNVILFFFF